SPIQGHGSCSLDRGNHISYEHHEDRTNDLTQNTEFSSHLFDKSGQNHGCQSIDDRAYNGCCHARETQRNAYRQVCSQKTYTSTTGKQDRCNGYYDGKEDLEDASFVPALLLD